MKALILDMDGLMIDSERLYFDAEKEMARKYGKKVEDATLWRMMGHKPIESMAIFVQELKLPVDAEKLLAERSEIMRQKFRDDLHPMPGLFPLIDTFYNKMKLSVATGAQREFLDIVVDRLGIREKFNVLQASDEIRNGKPDPEIYLVTCEKLKRIPRDCIVLEDSENGVLAGYRAGCYVIAVPSEYTKKQDFRSADFMALDLFDAARHIHTFRP
ncbi:MAG: HAD family phosphatase [Candidatus Aminicenantales bacterium]